MGDQIVRGIEIQGELRKAGADFLQTELEAALTFAKAALAAENDFARRKRDQENARKGYDTLQRFRWQFPVAASAEREFDEKLHKLKRELEYLGETDL